MHYLNPPLSYLCLEIVLGTIKTGICDALRNCYHLYVLKDGTLLLRFLNCTNGTKLRKISHICIGIYQISDLGIPTSTFVNYDGSDWQKVHTCK